ncbi:SMP-30/gluconolactonase/LRE family protein [Devosia rhodophyticola]|uniref:SMP-30/gluconolactonase/LRE family protein n=1 Tax=Devosia rhodophyticola TaxID=3026423 RepID=A0ABY7YXS8_9HYPH|nr:SMP-30/gluconolactonase/LRE family protein [Devosia rhodophyticola]WDR05893.1 SMP-30/gluconolactonase/LRE family protein [Devosia rhodophyticola]
MNKTANLLIDSQCALGEGPIWHPLRQQLFYFDIVAQALFAASTEGEVVGQWQFDEVVAAAGVIDRNTLGIATETGLKRFDLETGAQSLIVAIEADNIATRTNDSRVDRAGGFWIGTMRKDEGEPEGAVYHYRAGKLTTVLPRVAIPNATCFSPDGTVAYFADTPTKRIMQCQTNPQTGLPVGEWRLFHEVVDGRGAPDGAVTDSEGYLWNARWGGNCVVRHAPDGSIDRVIEVPVSQVTCPAFGGPDYKTLFLTSANTGMSAEKLAAEKVAGGIFSVTIDVPGLPETLLQL